MSTKIKQKKKEELILEHLPLVKKVAAKIYHKLPDCDLEFDDLVNTGIIGLIKAIDKYDERKAKFSTYAYIKIRGEILDFLRSIEVVPRSVKDKIKKEYENTDELSIPLSNTAVLVSIEKAIYDKDPTLKLIDTLVSQKISPEEHIIKQDLKEKILKAMEKLSHKEKAVLQMIFFEERDLKYISLELGISISRVSQLKTIAIQKIKTILKL
ncbi:MAG: sigma-70 family RNA polymerase sigma factor [Aquificae bacterium]|nr:sigma-70 family RNA polymerase sigma factor [Aquificota bacterium]